MSDRLGISVGFVKLKSGLFGKKPIALEIYKNGIILKYKSEDKEYLFEQISAIKTFNYLAPNPINYDFDIFNSSGEKLASVAVPYEQGEIGTALLKAHRDFHLGDDFSKQLADCDFKLDDYLFWQKGKLFYKSKKGVTEYLPHQIDDFVCKNGCYFFTLKSSKETIGTLLQDAPNCLTTIAVCKAIANIS